MSRRRRAQVRNRAPDPRYGSALVSHLVSVIMMHGKKSLASKIVYGAFSIAGEKLGKEDPVDLLLGALSNTRPKIKAKSRRLGGATYSIPVELPYDAQQSLALRWMRDAARSKKGPMERALADVLVDSFNNTGEVVRKKDEVHRMAQANRAFAHLG